MNPNSHNESYQYLTNQLFVFLSNFFPSEFSIVKSKLFVEELLDLILLFNYSEYRVSSLILKYKDSCNISPFEKHCWEQLYSIVSKLGSSKNLKELQEIMIELKEAKQTPTVSPRPFNVRQEYAAKNGNLQNYLNKETLYQHDDWKHIPRSQSLKEDQQQQNSSISSFENIDDRMSDIRSRLSTSTNRIKVSGLHKEPMCSIVQKYYSQLLPEKLLLECLPYTLLGVTSKLLPISENMTITVPKNMTNGDTQLLHGILEASLLFQSMTQILEKQESVNHTKMIKCILVSVSEKLQDYMQYINKEIPSSTSLRELYYKLHWKILELRFYNYLLSLVETKRGDELLSILVNFQSNCDSSSKNFNWAKYFLPKLRLVYQEYTVNWLIKGELPSFPHNSEFFIQEKSESQGKSDKDLDFISFHSDQASSFAFVFTSGLASEVPHLIYSIGKSIIYLVHYCKEYRWISDFSKEYSDKYSQVNIFDKPGLFVDLLNDQNEKLCKYIRSLLIDKYHLPQVFQTVQNLMLMKNGKFIDVLMQETERFLNDQSHFLQGGVLTRSLKNAIEKSSLRNMINKYDNNQILNGIDARILDLAHGSIGWDVFTLDYIIDKPFEPIFHFAEKKNYLKLFNFLWRLRRTNYLGVKEWKTNNLIVYNLKRLIGRNRPLIRDMLSKILKLNCCRNLIHQFLTNIESYVKQFLLEPNFQKFFDQLTSSDDIDDDDRCNVLTPNGILLPSFQIKDERGEKNIDEIQSQHAEMLGKILDHLLISNKDPKKMGKITFHYYSTSLVSIISTAQDFLELYRELNQTLESIFDHFSTNQSTNNVGNLTRFNDLLLKIVKEYGSFTKKKSVFIKELKLDGSFEAMEISRVLQ